jgi:hypothetical protein
MIQSFGVSFPLACELSMRMTPNETACSLWRFGIPPALSIWDRISKQKHRTLSQSRQPTHSGFKWLYAMLEPFQESIR